MGVEYTPLFEYAPMFEYTPLLIGTILPSECSKNPPIHNSDPLEWALGNCALKRFVAARLRKTLLALDGPSGALRH